MDSTTLNTRLTRRGTSFGAPQPVSEDDSEAEVEAISLDHSDVESNPKTAHLSSLAQRSTRRSLSKIAITNSASSSVSKGSRAGSPPAPPTPTSQDEVIIPVKRGRGRPRKDQSLKNNVKILEDIRRQAADKLLTPPSSNASGSRSTPSSETMAGAHSRHSLPASKTKADDPRTLRTRKSLTALSSNSAALAGVSTKASSTVKGPPPSIVAAKLCDTCHKPRPVDEDEDAKTCSRYVHFK